MVRVLKIILILIIIKAFFSCKKNRNITTNTSEHDKIENVVADIKKSNFETENPNCLKEKDSIEFKKYRKQLAQAIIKKDTLVIMNLVHLSYMDKNISFKEKKESLKQDFEPIIDLCLKEVMPEYALQSLNNSEYFDDVKDSKGCLSYYISNSFPSMEVTHIFIFAKVDGKIKLVEIQTIG